MKNENEYVFWRGVKIHNRFVFNTLKLLGILTVFLVTPIDYCLKVLGRRGINYTEERLSLEKNENADGYIERTRIIYVFSFSGALSRKDAYPPQLPNILKNIIRNISILESKHDK